MNIDHITNDFGYWFSGLADGEGSFGMSLGSRPKFIPACSFSLSLRDDDIRVLKWVRDQLGFGHLYARNRRERNSQGYISHPRADFFIHNKSETALLVALFRKFPLHSKKARDFEIWSQAVEIWNRRNWNGRWTTEKQAVAEEMQALMHKLRTGRRYQSPN